MVDFQQLVAQFDDAVLISLDQDGAIRSWNAGASRITQYTAEEIVGKPLFVIYRTPQRLMEAAIRDGRAESECICFRKDGTQFRGSIVLTALSEGFAALIRDQVPASEALQQSLREKELLLKEIHHRVKNNFQVVSSLLSIEAESPRAAAVKDLLIESQNRVASMALVHEKLYRSGDFARVDFADYLTGLTQILLDSYAVHPEKIRLTLNVDAKLEVRQAVPCGLIVNELLSNSLKHAFPDGRCGHILLRLEERNGSRALHYCDDGVGMPLDFDWRKSQSLGLQLVNSLTSQIRGTIRQLPPPGSGFEIEFPKAAALSAVVA
jgi:PAS domain S-box-containing protein